jgi:cytochrome c peroxidase
MSANPRKKLWFTECIIVALLTTSLGARAADPSAPALVRADALPYFASLTPLAERASQHLDPAQVELGRKLFFDPRMSADGVWSCMLCHQPGLYGTDAQQRSRGVFDKFLPRNAPTVLNSTLQFKSHWDGKFESDEDQAAHALLGPGFGNKDNSEAMARIQQIPGYTILFQKAFPKDADPVTPTNYGIAVGAYERTLLTPSRFDRFLDGQQEALSTAELKGLRLFIDTGCVNCHNRVGVGGNSFEKFGDVRDYWLETKSTKIDEGRFNLTKNDADKYVFKAPSLRNAAMTPPYFHDGSVEVLPEAVQVMAKVQLGKTLCDQDLQSIVAFLECLTGTIPTDYREAPVLPAAGFRSTPATVGGEKAH